MSFKSNISAVWFSFLIVIAILLGQGSDPQSQAEAFTDDVVTVEEYAEMGRVIVYGPSVVLVSSKVVGKGQCPLCHTFDRGDNIGRCPNLFGIEQRSHTRIKEDRYLNEPISIGEMDKASGIVKGAPDQIPEDYRREGSFEMTGEDYLRESMMCPSCYVVKGYGKAEDTRSPMPAIHKPPISLNRFEMNAVIAWLQSFETPGDYSRVTVPMPAREQMVSRGKTAEKKQRVKEDHGIELTCDEPECVPEMINALGCPLCHTIPGIEGAVGELGPPLHQKIDARNRILDPKYKGKAWSAREYVKESIVSPNIYIVFNEEAGEPYPEGVMPQNYAKQIPPRLLELLVDFISDTEPERN